MTNEEKKIYRVPAAQNKGLILAEFESNNYVHYVPDGIELEELLEPAAWVSVAWQLKPYDVIDLRWEDMSRRVTLHVMSASKYSATMFVVNDIDYSKARNEIKNEMPYFVKFRGRAKHSIIRASDGHIMQDGFSNEQAALNAMQQFIKNDFEV